MLNTPVAYIIFNRPRHTRETFAAIRHQQPYKLFIIADGPRLDHPTDFERCQEVRKIVEKIDWPCEVLFNLSDINLGCKQRVTTGLDWVFSQVDRAIILEDDILPSKDFFSFCEELLERYKSDDRISCITGNNFQDGQHRGKAEDSYYFSRYIHVWGWATWRRAWMYNNTSLSFWPEWKKTKEWRSKFDDYNERRYWKQIFDKMFNNAIDTWDYHWTASVWIRGGLTATPNVNLVTNIGFGPEATHTIEQEDRYGQKFFTLGPISHPQEVIRDTDADKYTYDHHFLGVNNRLHVRILRLVYLLLGLRNRS